VNPPSKTGPTSTFLGFGTALPAYTIDAATTLEVLSEFWPRLRSVSAEPVTRHLVAPVKWLLQPRTLGETMRAYAEHAPSLARMAACRALEGANVRPRDIDVVISVSCTGYLVPSLDVQLAREIGLRPDVIRLPLTELGCSGGAAAVAAAHRHLAAFPDHHVLIVAVELSSLSFQKGDRSIDNLTASMVFGDGAAAAVMGGGPKPLRLSILGAATRLLPDTAHVLGFALRESGFHVVLDRRLPQLIEHSLGPVVADFKKQLPIEEVDFYAVHAGGPRVFDAVESALVLGEADLKPSRRTFAEVGNLSSASILFTLAALRPREGDGMAIAFGPGVTIELAHLRWASNGTAQSTPGTSRARPRNASE
jgi:alkylresorcinol/alkylpyrone synthase